MSTIGQSLKEARNKKSISHEEIYAKIKIHPRILQLLEEEKFEKLPSPLFAKSFLRSYGEFLGVDSDELSRAYDKEKKSTEPEQVLYLKPVNEPSGRAIPVQGILAGAGALLLVLIVLFGVPSKLLGGLGIHTDKKTAVKKEALVKVKLEKEKSDKAKQEKQEKEKLEKDKQEKEKQEKQKKEEMLKKIELSPAPEEKTGEWLNTFKLGNFPNLNKRLPLDLEIKAIDAVWLHVTVDGKVIFQGILNKGSVESWKAKEAVEVWTGNASNMSLILNKNSLGSPGKGVAKKMIISHEGIRIAT